MAIFDDPKKELKRMEEELFAAEEEQWEEADDLSDIRSLLRDYDDEDYQEFFQEEEDEPAYRNYANDYGRPVRNYANNYGRKRASVAYEEEEEEYLDDDAVLYRDDYRNAKHSKEKGVRGLLVIVILEILAIIGILGWWLSWLL